MNRENTCESSSSIKPLENPWRRGPVTTNPYWQSAFRITRTAREITQQRTLVQRITETRSILRTNPAAHTVQGKSVTQEQLNAAEKTLLDPQTRILEELLHHRTERPPLDQIRRLLGELTPSPDDQTPRTDGFSCPLLVELLMNHLVSRFLETVEAPHPSFGASELLISPPFGPIEER
jgi:hypothetical protein